MAATAAGAVLVTNGLVHAQANSWIGPSGTTAPWDVGSNWSLGSPPNGEPAFIDNGGVAETSAATNGSALFLQVGSDVGRSGGVVQNGGTLTIVQNLLLGNSPNPAPAPSGTGTYTLNSGFLNAGDTSVGEKGVGTFTMNGGTFTSTAHMRLGNDIGSTGQLNMHGGQMTLGQFLLIGHFSPAGETHVTTGTLNMDGGTLNVQFLNLGQHPQALGVVHQSGGVVNNVNAFSTTSGNANVVIGETSRLANLYDLSGGTLNVRSTGTTTVGGTIFAGSSNGIGEFRISGNGNAQVDGHLFLGSGQGSLSAVGTFNISSGTLALGLNKVGGGFLVNGDRGTGTVRISGGAVSADFFQNGRSNTASFANSQGQVTQTGGSVTIRRAVTVGGISNNDNFYDISAGTLNITNDLSQGTLNDAQSGLHVARFSVDPGAGTVTTGYSKGRFTVSGTANVNIAGGLYNSTGFHRTGNGTSTTDADLPGGAGTIQMLGGTLSAGSFLNGGAANAGSFSNGGATANYVQSGGVASVGAVTGTGNVAVGGGTMTVASIQQAGVTVSAGRVQVTPNGTDTGASRVGTLVMSGGTLDLNNNDMVVTSGTYAAVATQIRNARNNGNWNGVGITSTTARNNAQHNTTLGVLKGSEYTAVNSGTFDGMAVAASDTLVKYTYYGDTDFNGKVNFDDYVRTDNGFNNHLSGWVNGDFDLNNQVNFDDYVLIDLAFNTQSGTLRRALSFIDGSDRSIAGMNDPALRQVRDHLDDFGGDYANHFLAAVPEPSALLGSGVVSLLAMARRRRRA